MEPTARRPHMPGYGVLRPSEGAGLLSWEWATQRLTRSRAYWLATVRPDARPHVTAVWGVWHEDSLWFSCSRRSRKARNLEVNPAVAATTDDPANPVVVEGDAVLIASREAIADFAARSDAKYATAYGVDFFADPGNACFQLRVVRAIGLRADDFTGSPTAWELPP